MNNARRITRKVILTTLLLLQLALWVQEFNMYLIYSASGATNWQFFIHLALPIWYVYVYPLAIFAALLKWPEKVELLLVFLAIHGIKEDFLILSNGYYSGNYMILAAESAAVFSIIMSIAIFVNYYLIWKDWNGRSKRSEQKNK